MFVDIFFLVSSFFQLFKQHNKPKCQKQWWNKPWHPSSSSPYSSIEAGMNKSSCVIIVVARCKEVVVRSQQLKVVISLNNQIELFQLVIGVKGIATLLFTLVFILTLDWALEWAITCVQFRLQHTDCL